MTAKRFAEAWKGSRSAIDPDRLLNDCNNPLVVREAMAWLTTLAAVAAKSNFVAFVFIFIEMRRS